MPCSLHAWGLRHLSQGESKGQRGNIDCARQIQTIDVPPLGPVTGLRSLTGSKLLLFSESGPLSDAQRVVDKTNLGAELWQCYRHESLVQPQF